MSKLDEIRTRWAKWGRSRGFRHAGQFVDPYGYSRAVWFIDDNHADCINNAPKDVKFLTEQIDKLVKKKHEMRLELQRHDCTYGDTPGLIHCPPDEPCTTHRLDRARKEAPDVG